MELTLTGSRIRCLKPDPVATGMVGAPVRFTFDSAWDGVSGKTAVFRCGGVEKQALLSADGAAAIPHEVLTTPGLTLDVGVYGTRSNGDTWPAPTPFCSCGTVLRGAGVTDDAAQATPTLVQQILNVAQSVRDDADNGDFQGAKGDKGDKGDTGDSAYQAACAAGYTGTAQEFAEGMAALADYAVNGWAYQPVFADGDSQSY